jgi:hypothetical protein
MHVYPVAGSQRAWALVTMCVPCLVAVGAGLMQLAVWRNIAPWMRWVATAAVCLLLLVTAGQWPPKEWHDYAKATPLNLPGARLIRIDDSQAKTLQELTKAVKRNCDTFYSTPGFDILYFYTQLPEPTGQLANWPGVLTDREQRDVAYQLRTVERQRQRVCIVRNNHSYPDWKASSYAKGPLGRAVAPFQRPVARVGDYSVLVRGQPRRGFGFRPKSGRGG